MGEGKYNRELQCGRKETQRRTNIWKRRGTTENYYVEEGKNSGGQPCGKRGDTTEGHNMEEMRYTGVLPCGKRGDRKVSREVGRV